MNAVIIRLILALVVASSVALAACDDGGDAPATDTFMPSDTSKPTDTSRPPDTSSGGNRAPELERIGDRVAVVGEALVITVKAQDPDGDSLTYSVFGALPEGARFDKSEHRFEWTPTTTGATVFLTFVVSDGAEFDRETVRIEVSAQGQQNPPEFVKVGDQQLTVGDNFKLTLEATDPDGDKLRFGFDGQLPEGASLDKDSGLFQWRPPQEAVGAPVLVSFTVSDGELTDTMNVRLVVTDGGGEGPAPPVFDALPAQAAVVGQPLSFTLSASDPNQDPLTFAINDGAPAGARLDGAVFSWTPAAVDAGRTYDVVFSVSDGTFNALTTVSISVTSGQSASCTPDAEEPNETIADAKTITPGSLDRTICESSGAYDIDMHAITVPAGTELRVTLTFDASLGDLDLLLLNADQQTLAVSDGITSTEQVAWTAPAEATVYVTVTGVGLEPLAMGYTLVTAFETPQVCVDDGYEENDDADTAQPVPDAVDLQICAGDRDVWTLPVACGQHVEIGMDVEAGGDLDMYLFTHAEADEAIASAATEEAFEIIDLARAPRAGTYYLVVVGYPEQSMESGYSLLADTTGGCSDDSVAGRGGGDAATLDASGGSLSGLALCCDDDWFALTLAAGDQVTVDATVTGVGTAGLTVLAADASTQLDSQEPSSEGGIVELTAPTAGVYYAVVTGGVGTTYGLEWVVEAGGGACTAMSCPKYQVCGDDGACTSAFCELDAECPTDHICRDFVCLNPCTGDDDCRDEHACKTFDAGTFCGVFGGQLAGQGCFYHDDCAGSLICGPDGVCVQL